MMFLELSKNQIIYVYGNITDVLYKPPSFANLKIVFHVPLLSCSTRTVLSTLKMVNQLESFLYRILE